MNWTSSIFAWGGRKRLQEIEWNTSGASEEMDFVLVNGRRVKSAPGLRFSDDRGLSIAKRSGWIIGWGKLEDLNRSNVRMDWVSKAGIEPKLHFFANCLLKLEEERRGGEKIILTAEQRKEFAQDLCIELIKPTGADHTALTQEGYFVLRKNEEKSNSAASEVEAQKAKLAKLDALPPIIVTALAMKELSKDNDLLSLEGAHERSSIIFNPSFKNSTVNDPAVKPDITQEYEELLGDLSNISLDKDVAMGAMTSLMDQTALSEADPEDFSIIEKSFSGVQEKFAENLQKIHVHNAKLNEMRENMEETFLNKQAHYEELNQTVANRNKELAANSAELSRLEREVTLITETKNQEIEDLEKQLQEAHEEVTKLKGENSQKVPATDLFAAEDQVADLQEKLEAQARRTKTLQTRLDSVKIDTKSRLEMMKTENRALNIKKEQLERTVREEKQSAYDLKREIEEIKIERDALQKQKDTLELSVQNLGKESRRLSSTRDELGQLKTRLSSQGSESDVFGSPSKANSPSGTFVQKMVTPETLNPTYIMTAGAKTSESVNKLLPKWTAGENVRNYTKRIEHAWDFVKGEFDEAKFINLVRISVSASVGEIIDNFLDETTEANERTVEKLCQVLVTKLQPTLSPAVPILTTNYTNHLYNHQRYLPET